MPTYDFQFVDSIGEVVGPVADAFGRIVSNGWGTADSGQAWSTSGGSTADYSVSGGQGRHSIGSLNVSRWSVLPVSARDVTVTASAATSALATGGSQWLHVGVRYLDPSNCYMARLEFTTTQQVLLTLRARVAGTDTVLGSFTTSITHAANTMIVCKVSIVGTVIQAKAWLASGSEPAGWQVTGSAVDPALTGPGAVGVRSLLSSSSTNTLPVTALWDDVSASGPATLRLDLNQPGWTVRPDTTFGMPELRRSVASTLLADGDRYPAAAYGNRTLSLVVRFDGVSDDAIAAAQQQLYRELDRPSNFLRYRPNTSAPVFFRTFRAGPDAVIWDPFTKEVTANIPAEPFAYGLKETVAVSAVANDPAAGSNGQFFDVTGVDGDVETPLFVTIPRTLALAQAGEQAGRRKTLLAVRRRGTPSFAPYLLQAEAMSSNPITGVTDTSASAPAGASGAARRTSFASLAAAQARLRADPFPASPSVDARGTYRAYVRVAATDGSSTFTVRLDWGSQGYMISNAATTLTRNSTAWCYVDLGLVQMPPGVDAAADALSGVADQVRGIRLDLVAGRTAGTGSLDWDFVVLAPADDRLLLAEWPDGGNVHANVTEFVLDPIAEAGYARDSAGVRYATAPVGIEGGFPLVSPGATNRITLIRDVNGWASGTDDTIASNPQPGAWYFPRYLYVRPPTT